MLNLAKSGKKDSELSPNSLSLGFIEALYADYLADPASVSADWRRYFQQLTNGSRGRRRARARRSARRACSIPPSEAGARAGRRPRANLEMALLQDRVDQLIRAYRVRGHMIAKVDPLGMPRPRAAGVGPGVLRLHRGRSWIGRFRPTRCAGPDVLTLRRHPRPAAQHLLPLDRRAVHAHRRPGGARMAATSGWKDRENRLKLAARRADCASSRG